MLAGFDMLAVPSQWQETGPLVVFEAQALGVPVLGSDLGGIAELITPGKKVRLGEGAFFGEMALLGNNLRSANITTMRVSRLLVLDLVDFRLLMARHPDLAETIDAEAKRRALENR